MISMLSRSGAFLQRILSVALPFGKRKFFVVVASMILQAILQLGGVASVLPSFRWPPILKALPIRSLANFLVSTFHITDPKQLVYVTGTLAIFSLMIASGSAIASQVIVARYVGSLGHWLRMQLLSKYYSQPYAYFVSRNSAVLTKKANHGRHTCSLRSFSRRFAILPQGFSLR